MDHLFAGIHGPITIITAAISGSIVMGVSGVSGTYMTEKAERTKKLKELERAMVTCLENMLHHRSHRFTTIFASLVDGLFSALAAMAVVSPFFLVSNGISALDTAFVLTIALTLLLLTPLVVYHARIKKECMTRYGIQMCVVGMTTAFLCMLSSVLLAGTTPI